MEFYSNGKLLISGEYLVLKGSLALAVPVKFGQTLLVSQNINDGLKWKTFVKGRLWFYAEFKKSDFEIIHSTDDRIAQYISKLLFEADILSGGKLPKDQIYIATEVDFDMDWGLGSSSSLISNLAYLADIDPYSLHFKMSEGSGYDIACARNDKPLFFQSINKDIKVEDVDFNPSFTDNLYFVYLGQKQNSANSIKKFIHEKEVGINIIDEVSEISRKMALANKLEDFEYYIRSHEDIISTVLKQEKIKASRFSDFDGEIKSLGAWGGDFALATYKGPMEDLKKYFSGKGLDVVIDFDKMVKC